MLHYSASAKAEQEILDLDVDFYLREIEAICSGVAGRYELSSDEQAASIDHTVALLDALAVSDEEDFAKCKIATSASRQNRQIVDSSQSVTSKPETSCAVAQQPTSDIPTTSPTPLQITPVKSPVTARPCQIVTPHLYPTTSLEAPSHRSPGARSRRSSATPTTTHVKPWRTLSPVEKFAEGVNVAAKQDGIAFSLNLSPKTHKGLVTSEDPCRRFSHYLNRELKQRGLSGVPYGFTFELSPLTIDGKQKLHLHGVIIPDGCDLDVLKRAVMAAGGKIAGRAASRQLKFDEIDNPSGWVRYCRKDEKLTLALLDRLTFVSDPLLRRVKGDLCERQQENKSLLTY